MDINLEHKKSIEETKAAIINMLIEFGFEDARDIIHSSYDEIKSRAGIPIYPFFGRCTNRVKMAE